MDDMSSYTILKYWASELPGNYRSMLFSKFLRSLRKGNSYFKLINSDAYYITYQWYIETLLKKPNAKIKLAVLTDDHDVVLGWSLMEPGRLHYVWRDDAQKGNGIVKELLSDPFTSFSHITTAGMNLWNSEFPEAKFNPF